MVTHHVLNVTHADLAVGLDIEGHHLGILLAVDEGQVSVHASGEAIEVAPHAGIATTQGTEVSRVVGLAEVKLSVLAIEPPHLACKRDDILRVEAVGFILEGECVDAGLVGVSRDTVVGNALRHPYGTAFLAAFAHHIHHPDLVGVTDTERLSLAAVAILGNEVGHNGECLTSRLCTLQGDVDEATIVDDAGSVLQLMSSTPSALADGHLMLVDVADNGIGVSHFGNLT